MQGEFWTIILVAIVLGADAFSLSMGMGIRGVTRRYELRFSALVGLFHVLMPLLGLSLGLVVANCWASGQDGSALSY